MHRYVVHLALLAAALITVGGAGALPPNGPSPNIVISQVYGGGGNAGAPFNADFVELFNRGNAAQSIAGWSVQYAAATGTTNLGANSGALVALPNVSIPAGGYFLVGMAPGATGAPLPTPDATGTINMSATGGKVALANQATTLGCNGGSAPCDSTQASHIVDLIGYDGANFFEGSAAPTLSNTTAAIRVGHGCTDTDSNGSDFTAGPPTPRNSSTATAPCNVDLAPSVTSTAPANGATGVAAGSNVSVTFSEPVTVDSGAFAISCSTSGAHAATVSGGPTTYSLDPATDFTAGESCTLTVTRSAVHDVDTDDPPDTMAADFTASFTVAVPVILTPIHTIQGAAHLSPLLGQIVSTTGIVTARGSNGFYLQDPNMDGDPSTSEGIFIFTSSAPTVAVADGVQVTGKVTEFRGAADQLTNTEIGAPLSLSVTSSGNALPAPILVGPGGRVPPLQVIENDATGNVETTGTFDPAQDGIDFWESLEGMRIEIDDAVAVGPTNNFGETQVVSNGAASVRTPRGGVIAQPNDFNPERVVVDDGLVSLPKMNVGDHYTSPLVGPLTYDFGNFFLLPTQTPTVVHDGVQPESTTAATANQLAVATFNVENLAPSDPAAKYSRLAGIFVTNLGSPDIVAVEEVQDNSGATDNGVVAADQTLAKLTAAIQAAGGPAYDYREIDPVDDQDGGQPGGNIRVVFLFRTDRGVAFVDAPGGTSTNADAVTPSGDLLYSPGRVDPGSAAWTSSRKPLAGEFMWQGQKVFVIANHFNSKIGDDPLEGWRQPPVFSSETQRHQQATEVRDFVQSLLAVSPQANVVVLGDLNDFQFSQTAAILETAPLNDLVDTLPVNERYTYVFEGNSETLDQILVSNRIFSHPFDYDVVHVNSEFADQASDHEPQVVRMTLNRAPSVSAGGPYAVNEGSSVSLTATGTDPDGDTLTYVWDLDNNGTFETAGQTVPFAALDGPATKTVVVRVTDPSGASSIATATVNVANVPPSATFHAPASAPATGTFTLAFTDASDPSPVDTAAGFQYAFDCGSGYGAFSTASTTTCAGQTGPILVAGKIRDKDGGVREYTAVVNGSLRLAKQQVLDEVNALLAAATKKDVQAKLRDAAKKLAESLKPGFWLDEIRLDPKDGAHVFDDEKQAADKLSDALGDQLVAADLALAEVAITDAEQADGLAAKIAEARGELVKARVAQAHGKTNEAIEHAKHAWHAAEEAISHR